MTKPDPIPARLAALPMQFMSSSQLGGPVRTALPTAGAINLDRIEEDRTALGIGFLPRFLTCDPPAYRRT